jgi:hypothetical protein
LQKKLIVDRIESEDLTVDDEPQIIALACEFAIKDYFLKINDFEQRVNKLFN